MNTFYHGDCLFVMNHDIEPNSIDLIYLDPPFFTGKIQKGTAKWQPGAMEVSYEDSKKFWGDTEKVNAMRTKSPEWLRHIAGGKHPRPDFASYLFYMMERLEACHRVLNDKGSIYLHCDWRASHYLKMIMDEIFGDDNFQNEIVWHYHWGLHIDKRWNRKHDSIIFYSKSNKWLFNSDVVREPYSEGSIMSQDPQWNKGYNPSGRLAEDVWGIPTINGMSKERVGYPTQKPLALLERIIKASSNEGDTILDPFCGCGTAIIAAQNLGRHWIGIDISKDAYLVTKDREHQLKLEAARTDYKKAQYVERSLDDVLAIDKPKRKDGKDGFEEWVNGFFKARKPNPDKGVDGITPDNIPIQTKTFKVTAKEVRDFLGAIILHPQVKKPCNQAILVSQKGIEDSARQQQSEIQTREGIKVELLTPAIMLKGDDKL